MDILGELFFHLRKSYKFDFKTTQFYAGEIIIALNDLHSKGIIYRLNIFILVVASDLKPENVLICKDGHLKIADFGLSKFH